VKVAQDLLMIKSLTVVFKGLRNTTSASVFGAVTFVEQKPDQLEGSQSQRRLSRQESRKLSVISKK
jgi:hypothetical protein